MAQGYCTNKHKSILLILYLFYRSRLSPCLKAGACGAKILGQQCRKRIPLLTYSPRLKPGDSGIDKDRASRDGLTSSPPTDDAPPV